MNNQKNMRGIYQNNGNDVKVEDDLGTVESFMNNEDTENSLEDPKEMKDNVELCRFHVGNERYMVLKPFKGEIRVHIRQYEIGKRGLYPTKSGVSLSLKMFQYLLNNCVREVKMKIKNLKYWESRNYSYHLGDHIYVTYKPKLPSVSIRQWFKPKGTENSDAILPTRKGLNLTFQQWDNIPEAGTLINQVLQKMWDELSFSDQKTTCVRCFNRQLFQTKGSCECHICENWFSTSCRDERPTLLKCSKCHYSRRI